MQEKQKNTITEKDEEFKIDVTVDGPIIERRKKILDKTRQFLRWCISSDQTALELTCQEQVVLPIAVARMDKPEGKKVSLGINADKIANTESAKLFAMLQHGEPVQVIIREIPKT